ncbi:MAG TPA: DUF4340 domain-containing protein [Ardenticatenaceae bacterium]|nr:DUF4340 domain-containing protein [Ardenticatenaceae bacterium]
MSSRTTLILLGILVALGGYVWWSGRGGAAPVATPTPAASALWNVDPALVQAIAVEPAEGPAARVEREGAGWQIVAPLPPMAADAETITRTLEALAAMQARRTLTDTTDLSVYGLSTPTTTLRLETGAETFTLLIGDLTPDGSSYYVKPINATVVSLVNRFELDAVQQWPVSPPLPPPPTPSLDEPSPIIEEIPAGDETPVGVETPEANTTTEPDSETDDAEAPNSTATAEP